MDISIFKDMTSRQPMPGTLEQVTNLIRSDERLKVFTNSYRQTGSKSFKAEAPLFAVACLFEGGKGKEHIRGLTGLSLVDFDHIISLTAELKEKIIADPHTLMCYTTISGNGLRVIYKYELEVGNSTFYLSAFYAGNAYYEKLIGCKADPQCKNITRLSGLAHDPDVFLRPESEVVPFTAEEIATASASYVKQSKEDKQMQRIQTYFDTLIAPQLAKANIKFQSGSHNEFVMRVGYRLAERRFSKKVVLKWAMQQFGKAYPDTEQVITSCFANASSDKNGSSKETRGDTKTASVEEIKSFLDGHVKLRMNEITSRVEFLSDVWQPINDRTVNSLWSQMSAVTRVNVQDLYRVIESDYVPIFNPFTEYLNNLPQISQIDTDKVSDYILELASTVRVKGGEEEQMLWYRYLRKWLVGMVASWLSDEVVNNVILVLIGEQGAFKTTWFNYLLPPDLKQYFYTKTNANRMTKDDLPTLAQYALVCCEELDTMRPAELNQLKAAVTMPSIDERAAYAHYHEHRKHIASFCGTGNNTQFPSDPTGNRRWLPFEVESIISPREHPFHYEGIYAQALALYKSGFQFWFTKEEIQELNRHNKQFETPHLEQELVDLYFRKPLESEMGEFVSVARALQLVSNGISQKLSSVNVGKAFCDLGFKRVRTNSSRGFIVVCRTAEEMKAYQTSLSLEAWE